MIGATIAFVNKLEEDLDKCTEPLEQIATLFIDVGTAANSELRDALGF